MTTLMTTLGEINHGITSLLRVYSCDWNALSAAEKEKIARRARTLIILGHAILQKLESSQQSESS